MGNEEAAKEIAEEIFDGKWTCSAVPAVTYINYLEYYNKKMVRKDDTVREEAAMYCEKVLGEMKKNTRTKAFIEDYAGIILVYYTLNEPEKAFEWYKKYWKKFEDMKNPQEKLTFMIGASFFFKSLEEQKIIKMKMPKDYIFYNEKNEYDVSQIIKYYRDMYIDIAYKLDKRNGTDSYMEEAGVYNIIE